MGLSKLRLLPSLTLGILDTNTVLVLVVVVAVVFGSSRLPKIARGLREARDEFQKASDDTAKPDAPSPPPAPAQPPATTPPTDNPPSE
jgi:TatA/E family protein of Tat protein translocase